MQAFPVPIGTPSHVANLFSRMYGAYSSDPLASPAFVWSMPSGDGTAYVHIEGVTATLYVSSISLGTSKEFQFNLAIDTLGNRPTLANFYTWLTDNKLAFFPAGHGYSVSLVGEPTLSTLALVEGFSPVGEPINLATSINYLQMRVVSLVLDLMAADSANMLFHLAITGAQGMWLSWIGDFYALKRLSGEDDATYKRRLLLTLAQPRENNVAIASLVSEAFGVADVLALDYQLFWAILYVFGSLAFPRLVMSFVRSIAPAGIIWTGVQIPPGGSLSGAVAGYGRVGTMSDTRLRRPPRYGLSGGARWNDRLALPLGGIFVVLH